MKASMAAVRIISFTTRLPADPNRQVTAESKTLSGFAIGDGTGAMAIAYHHHRQSVARLRQLRRPGPGAAAAAWGGGCGVGSFLALSAPVSSEPSHRRPTAPPHLVWIGSIPAAFIREMFWGDQVLLKMFFRSAVQEPASFPRPHRTMALRPFELFGTSVSEATNARNLVPSYEWRR
jgi:hypothetical protein